MIVVVDSLASLFSVRLAELELPLVWEEQGQEHRVFIYRRKDDSASLPGGRLPVFDSDGAAFLEKWPAYLRGSGDYTLENVSYHLDAFHGVADFDTPSGAVQTAVKLLSRQEGRGMAAGGMPPAAVLVYEPDQGHFPVWLATSRLATSRLAAGSGPAGRWVFSGRNILSLEAARHNTLRAMEMGGNAGEIVPLPAIDIALDQAALAALGAYGLIAFFPDAVPQTEGTERLDAWWEALASLLAPGGFLLAAFSASRAERFDRRKPRGFTRLGDVKRMGFRAHLYYGQ
jgi:hypothetical protein